uniref:Uncharacterized protein n=1 Tax=Angiostrongylus cantonensis TaxID=6313 RepID=A0A0K0D452_ANGCA
MVMTARLVRRASRAHSGSLSRCDPGDILAMFSTSYSIVSWRRFLATHIADNISLNVGNMTKETDTLEKH